jgi:hypothetical protein
MKNKTGLVLLTIGMTGLLAGGCGKTETAAPAAAEPDRAATVTKAEPTQAKPSPATQVSNTVPSVPTAAPATVAATAKAPETVVAPVKSTTPQPVEPPHQVTEQIKVIAQPKPTLASLSQDQVVQGLTEALGKGLQQAIARLGHDGGFLTNLNVKIPMPEKMQKVETTLRAMKQDKLADDFVVTMNHAAEQAVPQAGTVFADALKGLTIDDAKSILTGPNDAATKYFQATTQTNLYARFYPIVQKATAQTGVTASYKNIMEKATTTQGLGSLGNLVGNTLLGKDSLDIDAYVTNKAMDGLFKMVAEEEQRIRQNPVARTTDMLQKVFGALKK